MRERREISGYEIVKRIGMGGMSTVYEAIAGDGQRVALKLLHPAIAADPEARERLRREVSVLQRVKGPYVASILDYETEEDDVFIVTELIEGTTLEEDVNVEGRYQGKDLIVLGEELGRALRSIHSAGVLHRDLKPSNVMTGPRGIVLIDFGIAQLGDDLRITQAGSLAHTPGYVDPRVVRGAEPDEAADFWALAAVLAFACDGEHPFGRGSNVAVMQRVLHGQTILDSLDDERATIFNHALRPDLDERLSFDELVDYLGDREAYFDRFGRLDDDGNELDEGGVVDEYDEVLDDDSDSFVDPTIVAESASYEDSDRTQALPVQGYGLEQQYGAESRPSTDYVQDLDRTIVQPPVQQNWEPIQQNWEPANYPVDGHHAGQPSQQFPDHPQHPEGLSRSVPDWLKGPRRASLLVALFGAAISVLAGYSPAVALATLAVLFVLFDVVGSTRTELNRRRMRKGGPYSGETAYSVVRLPWAIVWAAIKAAFGIGLAGLLGFGGAWATAQLTATPPTVLTISAMAVTALVAWCFPWGEKARLGVRVVHAAVSPSIGYRIFWLGIGVIILLASLFFVSTVGETNWAPLTTNPLA